jgi:hypothetical protein
MEEREWRLLNGLIWKVRKQVLLGDEPELLLLTGVASSGLLRISPAPFPNPGQSKNEFWCPAAM